ncbi:hypothetical protein P5763_24375 [Bacillus cereus]|uniref:hypothetical protein n=1 Tax=Bacillus cereus TaxID=1396 RepID=UPI0024057ECA|nr:hypothetical protein [Bacillus cereus]MDF9615153.1 hypothetical protein [Bacillus cereus]
MEIQTEQKKNKKVPLEKEKINLVLYTIGGGIVGSALFAATTYGGQTVTNISTLIGGLGGGVISGFLTLQGVRKTIELQKEKEFEESKPQKVLSLHIMKKFIEEYKLRIIMLDQAVITVSQYKNTTMLDKIVEEVDAKGNNFERFNDKMIKESLNVNSDVYLAVKSNLEYIKTEDLELITKIFIGKFDTVEKLDAAEKLEEEITSRTQNILRKVLSVDAYLDEELTKYEKLLFPSEAEIN